MSWVCPMCSSNNADGDTRCSVCDAEREGIPLPFDLDGQMAAAKRSLSGGSQPATPAASPSDAGLGYDLEAQIRSAKKKKLF